MTQTLDRCPLHSRPAAHARGTTIRAIRRAACALLILGLQHGAAAAATLRVGPDQPLTRIADAARLAQDGDTVEIMPGEYRGDVTVWKQRKLMIRGVGRRPVLIADGKIAEDKAIWVIRNGEFEIRNIEFRGARVHHDNGAGIRFERGKLTIRNCRFVDNQNGILTGNRPDSELSIHDSYFADAPRERGILPHLLYVGRIGSFLVQGSRFENGFEGHLIKSRARRSDIRYNWIVDGDKGEASYEIDLPDGGVAVVVGNVIEQSATSQNPAMVAYGAEGQHWDENALLLNHNTLINRSPKEASFVRVWQRPLAQEPRVLIANSLTVGLGDFQAGPDARLLGNHAAPLTSFAKFATPAPDSPLRRTAALALPDDFAAFEAVPGAEPDVPVGRRPLPRNVPRIPGALQTAP